MTHIVKFSSALMDLGTHEHVICSALQFRTLYQLLVEEVGEVVKLGGALELEELATRKTNALEIKANALHFIRDAMIYSGDPRVKWLQQMCVTEYGIHSLWKGLPACKMLRCVDYMRARHSVSTHPGFTNVATNFSHLSIDEAGYVNGMSEIGQRGMAHLSGKVSC